MASSAVFDASAAFQLKGSSFTATVLELQSANLAEIKTQLAARTLDAAAWLQQSPVILSVEKIVDASADWAAIVALCQSHGVSLVGLRAPKTMHEALASVGLPVLASLRPKSAEKTYDADGHRVSVEPEQAAPAASVVRAATQVITQPVRGGQQIYAAGDLIILAPVSAGAEVLADGHIHIYGPLRGRALAGVQGDITAQVFCQSLEAELVSIAGRYRVADDLRTDAHWRKAARLSLSDDVLNLYDL
ncbi:MAG: septum site-determining protein MinC [Paraperlucidibaca sp.]